MDNKKIFKNKNGFTLIEIIVVISILSILMVVVFPSISSALEKAKISADQGNLKVLNHATAMYKIENNIFEEDVFAGISENTNRILKLVDEDYLPKKVLAQQKDASFQWDVDRQIWKIYINNIPIQLSPLGNNFQEISTGMISLIIQKFNNTGGYGRTWEDFRYTDLGLNPSDWQNPIEHMIYISSGSQLLITPENGYKFKIKNDLGITKTVNVGHNLIYETKTDKWYYHSLVPGNEVNIDTIEIIN